MHRSLILRRLTRSQVPCLAYGHRKACKTGDCAACGGFDPVGLAQSVGRFLLNKCAGLRQTLCSTRKRCFAAKSRTSCPHQIVRHRHRLRSLGLTDSGVIQQLLLVHLLDAATSVSARKSGPGSLRLGSVSRTRPQALDRRNRGVSSDHGDLVQQRALESCPEVWVAYKLLMPCRASFWLVEAPVAPRGPQNGLWSTCKRHLCDMQRHLSGGCEGASDARGAGCRSMRLKRPQTLQSTSCVFPILLIISQVCA